jgi:hypothetical protein
MYMAPESKARRAPRAAVYAVAAPRIYGFPVPIIKDIRRFWIRWNSVPEKTDLKDTDILDHGNMRSPFLLRKQYMSQGWETYVILQDATHNGPTTAIAIGSPEEWADASSDLSKWGKDVILRLHVDVCSFQGKLVSQPHVEPDPEYNAKEHLYMYRKKDEIRGAVAVQLLRAFFQST